MPTIMLVEDDPSMVTMLKTLLQFEGYQVITYDGAPQVALPDVIQAAQPDIVLMDVHLRKGNGISMLQNLRQDNRFKDLKVVMTSGMDLENECLKAGADDFVMKPFMLEDLLTALKNQLAR